ncbi:unnamed protein product [Paramecium octaurelia]|uniref:Uncharacterized protein n=1 Tax=Paramecium octaurelia TaxID=43137 RepID=A0A8S1VRW8_PAROT|nr:unnamed protein product [Paramecium octaurelia]
MFIQIHLDPQIMFHQRIPSTIKGVVRLEQSKPLIAILIWDRLKSRESSINNFSFDFVPVPSYSIDSCMLAKSRIEDV